MRSVTLQAARAPVEAARANISSKRGQWQRLWLAGVMDNEKLVAGFSVSEKGQSARWGGPNSIG